MLRSGLFFTDKYKLLQEKIKDFFNSQQDFLSTRTITSTRAVGDAVQSLLADNLEGLMEGYGIKYSVSFARRAMADLAFYDTEDFYYVVDVKTHRLDTDFNMPNLTSVERLTRFYRDDKNYFVVLELAYSIKGTHVEIEHVHFIPIEFLSWDCLTIGALGWGQIQIANSNRITLLPQNDRRKWMLEFFDRILEFYPAEIGKINERIGYFKKAKKQWLKRE